jgi:hypothetical protein
MFLMILEFSRQIFEKYSKTKFHKNLSTVSRAVCSIQTEGRTDLTNVREKSNNPFPKFRYCA